MRENFLTPATIAGTAVIITVEGRGALAPGMQIPALLIGVYFMAVLFEQDLFWAVKISC